MASQFPISLYLLSIDEANQVHQVWYDDAGSLKIKTGIAKEAGLMGVGMWTGDFVGYQSDPASAAAFWDAMGWFFV
jgi:spore germination protein YaaH